MISPFDIIALILISSACSIGFMVATRFDKYQVFDYLNSEDQVGHTPPHKDERMLLWWVRFYLAPWIGQLYKPLYYCLPCMGSVHSIYPVAAYIFLFSITWWHFFIIWPVVCIAASGLNAFIKFNYNTE